MTFFFAWRRYLYFVIVVLSVFHMGSNAKSGYIEGLPSENIEMEFSNFFSLDFSPVIPLLYFTYSILFYLSV